MNDIYSDYKFYPPSASSQNKYYPPGTGGSSITPYASPQVPFSPPEYHPVYDPLYEPLYNAMFQPVQPKPTPPPVFLRTDRNYLLTFFLSFVTLGIYPMIMFAGITDDVNTVCSPHDRDRTMNYLLMLFIVSPFTLGIGSLVWFHCISNRISRELMRRNIHYDFDASTFWLWSVLGSFIFVGPFIYAYKLFTASNLLNEDYNIKGK